MRKLTPTQTHTSTHTYIDSGYICARSSGSSAMVASFPFRIYELQRVAIESLHFASSAVGADHITAHKTAADCCWLFTICKCTVMKHHATAKTALKWTRVLDGVHKGARGEKCAARWVCASCLRCTAACLCASVQCRLICVSIFIRQTYDTHTHIGVFVCVCACVSSASRRLL